MRRWADRAAPDDPNVWYDVDGMWPTVRGTYETTPALNGVSGPSALTATGTSTVRLAWCGNTTTSRREFVVESAPHIWEYSAGSLTDRTGTATGAAGLYPMFAMYGDVVLFAAGVGLPTAKSTGANFSDLAGAPQAEIILTQSNAVLAFNTNTAQDGWAASDVGDYTNWTTGEAASGRLIATPGAIVAAVAYADYVLVFKKNSIYRMRYVGGTVKWASELLHVGVGCQGFDSSEARYQVCAGIGGVLFVGYYDSATTPTSYIFFYDGISPPRRVNPETTVREGRITYNPESDTYAIYDTVVGDLYYYCRASNLWGRATATSLTLNAAARPLLGEFGARSESTAITTMPSLYYFSSANTITRYPTSAARCPVNYIQTAMFGRPDEKINFSRVTPLLRSRNNSNGTTIAPTLTATFYRERSDAAAQTTLASIAEGTRQRFDITGSGSTDNFGRFKVTFNNGRVEIDDVLVKSVPAGKE